MPSIRDDIVGIQRGHLLPNFLKEKCYLRKIINDAGIFVKDKNDKDGFFWLGNSFNIRPQFRDAGEENCFWGQQHFEIKFKDHLLKNEFVYYEVEAMYYSPNDKVPIENRLLAYINYKKTNDWQDYVELFHVFIPNVSQEKWANLIDRESYREFIKNGDINLFENKVGQIYTKTK